MNAPPSLPRRVINDLTELLFDTIVECPTTPGSGLDVAGVPFRTAIVRRKSSDAAQAVQALAMAVRKYAQEVGAVRLHVLNPCALQLLVPYDSDSAEYTECEAYWDGLFEVEGGSLIAPDYGGVWRDEHDVSNRVEVGDDLL